MKIASAVLSAERKTSGELVTMIVPSSHDYFWVHWFFAMVGGVCASVLLWWFERSTAWIFSMAEIFMWQTLLASTGFVLAYVKPLKRFAIPKGWLAHQVHKQSLAQFMASNIHQTQNHTGVLIFLSLFERRVEILTDSGIHKKIPSGYWKEQVDHLVHGIHEDRAVETLCDVINVTGNKLSDLFPARKDEINELSNEVRLGEDHGGEG